MVRRLLPPIITVATTLALMAGITAPNGIITGQLDGLSDASRVKTLEAGVSCAA
ncbi:MAG: hypothetical protein ACRDYF_12985 [Acidimicrobiia bacterium]